MRLTSVILVALVLHCSIAFSASFDYANEYEVQNEGFLESSQWTDVVDPEIEYQKSVSTNVQMSMPQCLFCKTVVRTIVDIISKGISNEEIKSDLKYICKKLGIAKSTCNDVIDNEVDMVLQFVEDPAFICNLVHMCFGNEIEAEANEYRTMLTTNNISFDVEHKGSPTCSMCKAAFETIKHMIAHADKNKIIKVLYKFCKKTDIMRDICEKVVKNNTNEIIDVLTKNLSPRGICKKIGLCHKKKYGYTDI